MSGVESTVAHRGVGFRDAPLTTSYFLGGWILAQVAAVIALSALGYADSTLDRPVGVLGAALIAAWAVEIAACVIASRRGGTGDPVGDLGLRVAPVDLLGVPLGIAAQLGLVRLVYLPLQQIWPSTFDADKLEENARELVDGVEGAALVLLFGLVVIGAPVVEEIFYRGLLQRPWLARFGADRLPARLGVVVAVAAVFAAIHFRPVEFPGLFAFGLVVGIVALVTGRLGMAIVTHIAFNATALLLVV